MRCRPVRLRDRLAFADRQWALLVGELLVARFYKGLAWHATHGLEDQRITHAAPRDLNIHHAIAGAGKVREIKHGGRLVCAPSVNSWPPEKSGRARLPRANLMRFGPADYRDNGTPGAKFHAGSGRPPIGLSASGRVGIAGNREHRCSGARSARHAIRNLRSQATFDSFESRATHGPAIYSDSSYWQPNADTGARHVAIDGGYCSNGRRCVSAWLPDDRHVRRLRHATRYRGSDQARSGNFCLPSKFCHAIYGAKQ